MERLDLERPYTGPRMDAASEVVFMKKADYHAQVRYVRAWGLRPEGEEILVGNCRPEVVMAFVEKRSLRSENEVRLIRRRDSKLIKAYVGKYPMCREAQEVIVKEGKKEDLLCLLRTKFPLYPDVACMLADRGEGLLEAYLSPAKMRVV